MAGFILGHQVPYTENQYTTFQIDLKYPLATYQSHHLSGFNSLQC